MDFFEAVEKRRSIRRFTDEAVPEAVIQRALDAALLAPNSSNIQTWDFYWVKSTEQKSRLVKACMSQSAARTAQELIVITADAGKWRRSWRPLAAYAESIQAPKPVRLYYDRLIPLMNITGLFNILAPFKWLGAFLVGWFRPVPRGPFTKNGREIVAIKSAALAAENFMLAITAQGYASCPMEGFDDWRVRRALKLGCRPNIVMVVGVGREAERGTWGPRFRLPKELFVHEV